MGEKIYSFVKNLFAVYIFLSSSSVIKYWDNVWSPQYLILRSAAFMASMFLNLSLVQNRLPSGFDFLQVLLEYYFLQPSEYCFLVCRQCLLSIFLKSWSAYISVHTRRRLHDLKWDDRVVGWRGSVWWLHCAALRGGWCLIYYSPPLPTYAIICTTAKWFTFANTYYQI